MTLKLNQNRFMNFHVQPDLLRPVINPAEDSDSDRLENPGKFKVVAWGASNEFSSEFTAKFILTFSAVRKSGPHPEHRYEKDLWRRSRLSPPLCGEYVVWTVDAVELLEGLPAEISAEYRRVAKPKLVSHGQELNR